MQELLLDGDHISLLEKPTTGRFKAITRGPVRLFAKVRRGHVCSASQVLPPLPHTEGEEDTSD